MRRLLSFLLLALSAHVLAQGQDSEPYERDFLVIDAMLEGMYGNANQSYFDRRVGRAVEHAAYEVAIARDGQTGHDFMLATVSLDDGSFGPQFKFELVADAERRAVIVRVRPWPQPAPPGAVADEPPAACELVWRRSAAEFVAEPDAPCRAGGIHRIVLSERQLWLDIDGLDAGDLEMHRARGFECYADIPGVGGGRDEPYDRYDGLLVHDQGGAAWFTTREGRRLGVSLLLVDWPINNYEGAFARDSLVVYVSEETDAGREELGYAFTTPQADRIGINLKWMLVNCFMLSNESVKPYM